VIPRSIEQARYLLPPAAYCSASWAERERDGLFGDRWTLIASLDELSQPGDYATGVVGYSPVVVVRDRDATLRAFHNLCRHRGMVLLQGSGHLTRTIECFYHRWRYAFDGSLRVVPQRREQFPDIDVDQWGLRPAGLAVWEGMVFVHPDPEAPPLAETLGELPAHLGSHRPGLLRQVAHERIEARCNWKLLVENHVDVYHLWYLHEESLGGFDHRRFEHLNLGRNWVSYEPVRGDEPEAASLTSGSGAIGHLDRRDVLGLGAHLVFPNLMMAAAGEFFATYVAEPVAPDRTVVDLRIRAEEGADATALVGALRSFISEDVAACEAVQAAVSSPSFGVGPLAVDHELPITRFHRSVLDALGSAS
jgi:choline monooxygenase